MSDKAPPSEEHRERDREREDRRLDLGIAALLATVYVTILVKTVNNLGYARDEGFYFQASSSYARWFELLWSDPGAAVGQRAVDSAWSVNHEHPALVKSLFALSNLVLQKKYHLFAMEGTSYRFPGMLFAGLAVALVYWFGAKVMGRAGGLAAAIALAAMPRFFYHAHLACFDVPIVAVYLLTVVCYFYALQGGGIGRFLAVGVAFGLALDTKHNSWFLPFLLGSHAVALEVRALLAKRGVLPAVDQAAHHKVRLRALASLGAMAAIGPVVFVALWPWIWRDTIKRFLGYASFHLNHDYYNMELFGVTYWAPPMPRTYAPVMTAATVPTVTLLFFFVGLGVALWATFKGGSGPLAKRTKQASDPTAPHILWIFGVLVNYGAWVSPKTPIFGGTKHWMTAYPFLVLLAGLGFSLALRAGKKLLLERLRGMPRPRKGGLVTLAEHELALPALMLAVAMSGPIAETAHAHPWGLSAYTPLVGGAPGAASLGLNRTFWGYTTGSIAPKLNADAPRGATVHIHDTAGQSWDMLLREGRIRRDLRPSWTAANVDYGLYHHEPHMGGIEAQTWVALGTPTPWLVDGLDGVPVIWVFKNPKTGKR